MRSTSWAGVDIEITPAEFKYINSFITETVKSTGIGSVQLTHPGMNHLDGVQAVAYARLRLMDTDYNRTERQRKVVSLLMDKIRAADTAKRIELVTSVLPETKTSMGLMMCWRMPRILKSTISQRLPVSPLSETRFGLRKRTVSFR